MLWAAALYYMRLSCGVKLAKAAMNSKDLFVVKFDVKSMFFPAIHPMSK